MFFTLALAFLCLAPGISHGQGASPPPLIRDTEIEEILKNWAAPLIRAAGIDEKGVHIVIVQSPQINAFVAGGANIFIYTGLITKTETPGELLGVLAHELGHIAGGHLIATRQAMEKASYETILGGVIGLGAAIATGEGKAAQAIITGSGNIASRRFLSFSRIQESSADQAALSFLQSAALPPEGLASLMEKLESEELLPASQQSEYVRTHPLSRNRIDAVEQRVQNSPYRGAGLPAGWEEQHARMKAKLLGFINPAQVPWTYNDNDHGIPAQYARAIASYRTNAVETSLREIDALLAAEPDNPYFLELKGQALVDFGRVKEALPYYRKAVSIKPDAGLIRIALGAAVMEADQSRAGQQEAIEILQRALREEPRSSRIRRLLATAYGRLGQDINARLNLAEEAALVGRFDDAKAHAEYVIKTGKPGSREYVQARDIQDYAETADKDNN